MGWSNKLNLPEEVAAAAEALEASGSDATVRAVMNEVFEKTGVKYSVSTIHPHLKRHREEREKDAGAPPVVTDDHFRPALRLMKDLVKKGVEDATRRHAAEIERARKDLDAFHRNLEIAEAERDEAQERLAASELLATQLRTELNLSKQALEDSVAELEAARAELARRTIREADYLQAKNEAAEAMRTAAVLEGRLSLLGSAQALLFQARTPTKLLRHRHFP